MIKTVLSVEDDKVTQILNRANITVSNLCQNIIEAYNGEEALEFFKKLENGDVTEDNFPNVILLDLNMPVMDGWDFFDSFKKEYPHFIEKTKIYVLSSTIDPADEKRAKEEKHINAFFSKPLDIMQIEKIKKSFA